MPKISVILTSFNHAKYINESIDSVLNQTFTDFELIILDDASSDNSWNLISQYSDSRIKAFRSESGGEVVYRVNDTLSELAVGEYIAVQHSDDVWELDKLEKQVAFLDANLDIGAVFANALAVAEDGSPLADEQHFYSKIFDQPNRTRYEWLRFFFSNGNALCHPSVLIRKACYEDCGLYRFGLAQLDDFDMWIRLCLKYEIHVLQEKLVRFRVRDNEANVSGNRPAVRIRATYEFYKLLSNYRKIARFDDLVKVFPIAGKYHRNEEADMGFVLAMIALEETPSACTQLFGQDLLFEAMSDPKRAVNIKRLYDFDNNCYISLMAQYDVFSREVVAERDGQIANLNQSIAERDGQIATMTASRSWQLTKPLRFVWQLTHGEFRMALMPLRRARRLLATASALCHAVPRVVSFYGSLPLAIRRVLGILMHEGFRGVARHANIFIHGADSGYRQQQPPSAALYGEVPPPSPGFMPKVSIIVPNFNHAKYLPERLESIYGQTYGNIEVILLDDGSKDESVAILRECAERYPGKTICHFNEVNSGGVFNQWKKGLELATGELVWIAESDDCCSANLLEELVRSFRNPAVMLAFARSDFVRGAPPVKVWTTEEYLSDLDLGIGDRPFIQSAHTLVKNGWAIKNLVPNVSSAVFRHPGNMALFDDAEWARMRLCGDWIFYLSLIRGGLVAYSPNATNYYRQHSLNTSVNAQNENIYYQEFEVVARHLVQNYALDRSDLKKQERQLYQHWCSRRGYSREDEFRALYDLDRVWQAAAARKPNLMMAIYALTAGGGETFPIMLANLLHDRGYAVTLLNCRQQPTEPGVQHMVSSSIPLLELKHLDLLDVAFADMGVELVHSHHAWVDMALATSLLNHHQVRQVVTLHGMYEMMPRAQMKTLMPLLDRIDSFVYVAEKNLSPFPQAFRDEKRFYRIDNALPPTAITPVPRAELGIGAEDFVLCLVSRAIPDKGWKEAIGAVTWAHARSRRKIHLLLIGDGVELERLRSGEAHDFVHFLGFRSNTRDYFATSDIGFLPSRFKGESFPLVLIDCLLAGKPILASDVGEVRYMLDSAEGLAGELFDLEAWEIRVEALGQIILTLANDPLAYQRLLRCVPLAVAKFDADTMVDKYEEVYRGGLASLAKSDGISAHHPVHP